MDIAFDSELSPALDLIFFVNPKRSERRGKSPANPPLPIDLNRELSDCPRARDRGYVIICADGLKLSCFWCRKWAFSAHKGVCPTYVAIWLGSEIASNPHYTWISIFGKFSKKTRERVLGGEVPLNARYNCYEQHKISSPS